MIVIDGESFDIPIISIKRNAEFLDKYAERTEDGVLHRELIGVYFNYSLSFGRTGTLAEYASLWAKLTEVEEFHTVVVPDFDGTGGQYTFTAYFAGISDELIKESATQTFWKNLVVNFIAQSPA